MILGVFRLICTNGLVVGLRLFSIKKRHLCEVEEIYFKQAVSTALIRFSEQVREWNDWAGKVLPAKAYAKVMEGMALGKKGTEEIETRMLHEATGVDKEGFPIISVWLFFNTLTSYITHRAVSVNHRVEMEEGLRKAMVNLRSV